MLKGLADTVQDIAATYSGFNALRTLLAGEFKKELDEIRKLLNKTNTKLERLNGTLEHTTQWVGRLEEKHVELERQGSLDDTKRVARQTAEILTLLGERITRLEQAVAGAMESSRQN